MRQRRSGGGSVIEARRLQRSFGDGLIAEEPPEAHFNGKLERPTLWAGGNAAAALARQRQGVPKGPTGRVPGSGVRAVGK